jgi:hypothetical protein
MPIAPAAFVGASASALTRLWLLSMIPRLTSLRCAFAGAFTVWARLGHAVKNNLIFYAILTVRLTPRPHRERL